MQEHLLVERIQQFVTGLMVVQLGEIKCVAFRNGTVKVFMQGPFGRHRFAGNFLV